MIDSSMVITLDTTNRLSDVCSITMVLLGNSKMHFHKFVIETPRLKIGRFTPYDILLCFDPKKHVDFIKKIRDFENHFDLKTTKLYVDLQGSRASVLIPMTFYPNTKIEKDGETILSRKKTLTENNWFCDSSEAIIILENPVLQITQTTTFLKESRTVELHWSIQHIKLYSK